jgi:hypothetical protein
MEILVFGSIEIVEEWDDRSVGIGLTIVELKKIIMQKERKIILPDRVTFSL